MRKDEFPIIDKHVKNEINAVLDKIRAEIKFITDSNGVNHIHRDDVFKIIDKYRGTDEITEHYKKLGEYYNGKNV